ncbi:MAG: hypothetical protein KY455_00060 [Euryarchaeota archaeon]|nr:hypothetical protein [Euryarchaeota archaeon]
MPSIDKKKGPASTAAGSSAAKKRAKDVEPIVDPEMPDGIPVVKEGRKVKDPKSAPVEDCPVCGNAFRHHVKDKEGQCPHCEAFLALDAEPREPSPPPGGPKADKAEARAAERARKKAEKEQKKAEAAEKKAMKKRTKKGGDGIIQAEPEAPAAETPLLVEEDLIEVEETVEPLDVEEGEAVEPLVTEQALKAESEVPVEEEEVGLELEEEVDTERVPIVSGEADPPGSEIPAEEEEVGLELEDEVDTERVPIVTGEAEPPESEILVEEEEVGLELEDEPEVQPAPEEEEPVAVEAAPPGPKPEVDMPSAEAVPPPIEVDVGAPYLEPLGEDDDLDALPDFTVTAEAIEEDGDDDEEPVELPRKRFFGKKGG